MKLSNRLALIAESKSVQYSALLHQLRLEGKDIIGLNVGEPDFLPPLQVHQSIKSAIDEGKVRYSLVPGVTHLREKTCQFIPGDVKPENIFYGTGSKQILYLIFQTILSPGDEVLIPKPYWVSFPEGIKLAGGQPVLVECLENFQIDLEDLEKKITSKTKAIVVNTPNNPSGRIIPGDDIKKLMFLAEKHDLIIVSDEAYVDLYYGSAPILPAEFEKSPTRVISTRSFSKNFAMTGHRIGYASAHQDIIKGMAKIQSHLTGNIPPFIQEGAFRALELGLDHIAEIRNSMKEKSLHAHQVFESIFDCEQPEGGLYLYFKIPEKLKSYGSDEELATFILEECGVALLPGSFFGHPGHLRISFAASLEDLSEAGRRMEKLK